MEPARANHVRMKPSAFPKTELRQVDNVWNNLRQKSEFSKHIDEISRRNHQAVCVFQHQTHAVEPAEMIARLAAVIVNHCLCSMKPANEPRRKRRDEK